MKKLTKDQRFIGSVFGKWTVVKRYGRETNGTIIWECLCGCGNIGYVRSSDLNSGSSNKCKACHLGNLNDHNTTHGMTKTSEYNSWKSMVQRCTNKDDVSYKYWGGRGITVCDRWLKFENFLEDMGQKPSPKLSIERLNNNDGYYKENCCWATAKQQANNRRNSKKLNHETA